MELPSWPISPFQIEKKLNYSSTSDHSVVLSYFSLSPARSPLKGSQLHDFNDATTLLGLSVLMKYSFPMITFRVRNIYKYRQRSIIIVQRPC